MTVPKYMGSDCELSTTGIDARGKALDNWDATQRVLEHIDAAFEPHGVMAWREARSWGDGRWIGGAMASARSSDCCRSWTPNGQCFYSDMSHLEVCTAETKSPRAYAAQLLSTLTIAEAARRRAEDVAEDGSRLQLSAANADLRSPAISWGSHFNVSIATDLWEDLFVEHRHPAVVGFVASMLAAAIPFFGAGYLLPLHNGQTLYSLSARAHHLTRITSVTTTQKYRRGMLNSRREPHGRDQERLHIIGFDCTPIAAALRACFVQCGLAAAEEGFCDLNLYEPVNALGRWSWGLDLRRGTLPEPALLVDGRSLTLPRYIAELAGRFAAMVEAGLIDEQTVPEAAELLPRIIELADLAERGELARCARHLDWAAKLLGLLDVCSAEGAAFGDDVTRLADHDFANTDPERGVLWALWEQGLVDPLVDAAAVRRAVTQAPEDGRGWARAGLVTAFGDDITSVDWSRVELARSHSRWDPRLAIEMPDPGGFDRERFESILAAAGSVAELEALLDQADPGSARHADPVLDLSDRLASDPDDADPA